MSIHTINLVSQPECFRQINLGTPSSVWVGSSPKCFLAIVREYFGEFRSFTIEVGYEKHAPLAACVA